MCYASAASYFVLPKTIVFSTCIIDTVFLNHHTLFYTSHASALCTCGL